MRRTYSNNETTIKRDTLLWHINQIIEMVEDSNLSEEFYSRACDNISFVADKLDLTNNQAVIFSIFVERSNEYKTYISQFADIIGCRQVKIIAMQDDFDELERRKLIRQKRDDETPAYRIPKEVLNSIKKNLPYTPKDIRNISIHEVLEHLKDIFDNRYQNEISFDELLEELEELIEANQSLEMCKQLKRYNKCLEDQYSLPLLLLFVNKFLNNGDNEIALYEWEHLFDVKWKYHTIKKDFENGTHELIKNNIIEHTFDEGFASTNTFCITEKTKAKLFVELNITSNKIATKKSILEHKDIVLKKMFYNKEEEIQINQLLSILSIEKYNSVQQRLEEKGFRKGFTCLFHGAPGTGKTETAYQIAKQTGRNIMIVDIAKSKSMWFGESEKIIKRVFDTYKECLKDRDVAPILLFNEADAIFSTRKEIGNSSVSQTENTIQNILLQEMENLEGILIATTNMTKNIDEAFERRFLYKVKFEKPCKMAKMQIWGTMIDNLSEEESIELANTYNFSGGQIENIARKCAIESIINNHKPSINTIHQFCRAETLSHLNREIKSIGFTIP